jgi:2-oxoisovalerate dehydrogenase E2 component (dihydrolipoyl transacylase)
MTIFNLPDLGEGLLDAEIHEWYVQEGDEVKQDQPIVSMETAKAVVDVPAPQAGIIKKRYGDVGSIIRTGSPLIEFNQIEQQTSSTVVGKLEEKHDIALQHFDKSAPQHHISRATIATKRLANQLGVNLDQLQGTGEFGLITAVDVAQAATQHTGQKEALKGVRRQMAQAMELSHQQVVPVTIYDDADITSWVSPYDITVKLIQALCFASSQEPSLNAWFNGHERELLNDVHLGVAMDSKDGLFVPVIEQAQSKTPEQLREEINRLKIGVANRSLPPQSFQNASITLSNFGKFAGKYASPIIVPPMVAILAVGRLFKELKMGQHGPIEATRLPLSLTFDHRAITGGEATRFLGAMIQFLEN